MDALRYGNHLSKRLLDQVARVKVAKGYMSSSSTTLSQDREARGERFLASPAHLQAFKLNEMVDTLSHTLHRRARIGTNSTSVTIFPALAMPFELQDSHSEQ